MPGDRREYWNAWRAKNLERMRALEKARYQKKRAELLAYAKAWRAANRERVREIDRRRRERYREKLNAKARERYRAKSPEVWTREDVDLETVHEWSHLNEKYKPTPGEQTGMCMKKAQFLDELLSGVRREEPKPERPKPTVVIRRRVAEVIG